MALRHHGSAIVKQDLSPGDGPMSAYWMLSGGVYVLGSGNKASEADAYMKNSAGTFILDDSSANEDRTLFLTSTNVVIF